MANMICRKADLDTFGGEFPVDDADTGVVDENVQALGKRGDPPCSRANRRLRAEVHDNGLYRGGISLARPITGLVGNRLQ